ncbi:MAG: hypothetical protein ACK5FZ_12540 [Bacteroidota bacterium]
MKGGSATMYNKWSSLATSGVEVRGIELSGRGVRAMKPLYQSFNDVVKDVLSVIESDIQSRRYAFFGLKTLPIAVKNYLLNLDHYTHIWVYNHQGEQISIRYCTYEYEGRTIICTYNEKRAAKDQQDRQDKLQKAELLLKHPNLLKRKAHHYFLKTDDQTKFYLHEEKIKQSARYDGLLAISTNTKELPIEQVLDNYRHLYQIEHSFRTFKTHLETRPMFLWTDKRIEGHICLCYMAYTLLTHVQNKLLKGNIRLSENQIRKALDAMQVSLIRNNQDQFYLRSANKENIDSIVNRLGLKKLPNIIPKTEINTYLR